jgi:hypothetical protein
MALDSNAIWDALKARLEANVSGFTRVSRRRRDWSVEEHPVLMVLDDSGEETLLTDIDDPAPMWRLTGELIVLVRNNDIENPGDDFPAAVDTLKRSVMEALERKIGDPVGSGWSHYTDLGGLVRVLSVPKVEKGNGDRTGQAVVRIGLVMETNPP